MADAGKTVAVRGAGGGDISRYDVQVPSAIAMSARRAINTLLGFIYLGEGLREAMILNDTSLIWHRKRKIRVPSRA